MPSFEISLENKVAVVTGGGGGIGRAIALSLASAGADLVILDIVPERCEEITSTAQQLGRQVLASPVDVTDSEAVRDTIVKAAEHFGRLDILVNNAGGVSPKAFLSQSENSWRRHIDLNLVSALTATSATVPVMIQGDEGGAIINVASIEGSRAAPNFAVYAACKAGLLNLTRSWALEFADHGIRVNAIAPDYTVTPGLSGNITGPVDPTTWMQPTTEQQDATARRIPMGRTGIDSECGNVALFLASNMSDYVTGSVIPVDGGSWASSGWIRSPSGNWTLTGLE